MRQQAREQLIGHQAIGWQSGLEQGNRLGHGAALNRTLSLQYTLNKV
jgi:hypothetical protein